jgi:hypothetical protein
VTFILGGADFVRVATGASAAKSKKPALTTRSTEERIMEPAARVRAGALIFAPKVPVCSSAINVREARDFSDS